MTKNLATMILVAAGLLLALSATASADTVWVSNTDSATDKGAPYKGQIQDLKPEGLVLLWDQTKQAKTFVFGRVRRVALDDVPELGTAEEAYVAGDAKRASTLYATVLGKSSKPWLGQYINFRLVDCYGQTKQFARAIKAYVDLCQTNAALAAVAKVPAVMPKGTPDNAVARKTLDDALTAAPTAAYADKLKRIRMNILMVEGDPAEVLAVVEAELKGADADMRAMARMKHIELLMKMNKFDEMGQSLEQGRKDLDAAYNPQLCYFEGRYLYGRKDFRHAALSFMRVPILYAMSNKELAAESLVWASKSMREGQGEDKVPVVEVAIPLREAVTKFPGTPGAAEAQKMLKELGVE